MQALKKGVFPTMITPYNQNGTIDFGAVRAIVDFYRQRNCDGIFAVCQSSEMFYLSLEERVALARAVVDAAGNDMEVIAAGHVSYPLADQIKEMQAISDTGVKAAVLVSNRLAANEESDDAWIANAEKLASALGDTPLGVYECPFPYKRLLSDKVLSWMADSGRFTFIKDTCCDAALMKHRIQLLNEKGGTLGLYNANSATMLSTLRDGAAGFSGVMGNFHPELYTWLCRNWDKDPQKAEQVQALLTAMSMYESFYPLNAKYHMNLVGVPMQLITRNPGVAPLTDLQKDMVRQLMDLEDVARALIAHS